MSMFDNCPVIPPGVIHLHWDISNPDRGYTDDETRRIEFGKTRDEIRRRVEKLYSEIETDNVLSE